MGVSKGLIHNRHDLQGDREGGREGEEGDGGGIPYLARYCPSMKGHFTNPMATCFRTQYPLHRFCRGGGGGGGGGGGEDVVRGCGERGY